LVLGTGGINLTHQIAHELGVAIVAGEFSEGKAFPTEAALCERFNVSRSILREAVKMLTAKGLLAARPRQGTWVQDEKYWNLLDPDVLKWLLERKFSLSLIRHFTETRRAFEPQAARLAALHGGQDQVQAIEQALERMINADQGEDDPLQSDIAFHIAVLRASQNPFYIQLEELIICALTYSIRLTNKFKGVTLASIDDHQEVLKEIKLKKPEKAAKAMEALIDEALSLIIEAENNDKLYHTNYSA